MLNFEEMKIGFECNCLSIGFGTKFLHELIKVMSKWIAIK